MPLLAGRRLDHRQHRADIADLAAGTFFSAGEGTPTPTPEPSYAGVKPFAFGTFDNPKMTAEEATCPWQRTIEWPVGFWSVPVKDAAQNDLEIDFMMYVTSPEGWGIYLENKLDPNNPNGGITGPTIVRERNSARWLRSSRT